MHTLWPVAPRCRSPTLVATPITRRWSAPSRRTISLSCVRRAPGFPALYLPGRMRCRWVLEECERTGIAFIPWFPLATGKLATDGGPFAQIAERHDATPAQIALAWLLNRSPVTLPIPGTAPVEHLEENVGAARIELSADEVEELDALDAGKG